MFARFFRRTSSLLLVGQFLLWLSAWAGDKEEVVADLPKKRAPAIPRVGIRRLLMDGGIRSGTDVLAALATGAKAVLVGRAYAYGLGAAGEAGVTKALQILRSQIEHTMRLLGRQSIAELDATCLVENPFQ